MRSGPTSEPLDRGVAYVDGRFKPISEATISILDWGFSRSDVTYDVVAVTGGSFFRLSDHLDRFERSMKSLHLDPGLDRSEISAALHGCVALSGLQDSYVEMLCTRGVPPSGSRDVRTASNRFAAYAIPYVSISGNAPADDGMRAVIATSVERIRPEAIDPTVKNFHWGDLVRGLFEAYERGGETVILTDGAGNVTEGPGFNVFAVTGDAVRTPHVGVLHGITRRTVSDICGELDVAYAEGEVSVGDLAGADEIFITSTAGGIVPVTELDGRPIGDGTTGPLTDRIHETYWRWHSDPRWTEAVDYEMPPEVYSSLDTPGSRQYDNG